MSSWVSEVTALCLCLLRGSWAPQDPPLDPRIPGEKGGSSMHTWRSLGLLPHTPRWVGGEWRIPWYLSLPGVPHGSLSLSHTFSGKMPGSVRLAGPRTAFDSTQPTECN